MAATVQRGYDRLTGQAKRAETVWSVGARSVAEVTESDGDALAARLPASGVYWSERPSRPEFAAYDWFGRSSAVSRPNDPSFLKITRSG